MFIGHFALAYAAKAAHPKPSFALYVAAAQLADILWPIFLFLGWEHVEIAPGDTAMTPLRFTSYPISHSLIALIGWGLLLGLAYRATTRDGRGAVMLGALVVSHWVLDFLTHRPDLPLVPGSEAKFGLEMWRSVPVTMIFESLLFAAALAMYFKKTKARDRIGSIGAFAFIAFLVVSYLGAAFGPPPPSVFALALTSAIGAVVFVAAAAWIDRHREPAPAGRSAVALAACLCLSIGCTGTTAAPGSPPGEQSGTLEARRKALDALLAEQWEYSLKTFPEFASILGDTRYNDRWSDQSLAAIMANYEKEREFLARFEAIDTTDFPEQEALNQQLMVRSMREDLEGMRFEEWLMPIDQMNGVHIQIPQLVPLLRFQSVKDYEDYLARLRTLPAVIDQILELLRSGVEKKLMPPRFLLERTVPQANDLASAKPEESPFGQPALKFPDAIPAAEQERLRTQIFAALREQVFPAYAKLTAYLRDEYAPKGRTEVGVWSLPDGDARYAFAVKRMTTTTLPPDEIHQIGLREVARIEAEQEAIGKKLGFANLAAFRKHVAGNKKLFATTGQDLLDHYQKYTDRMYEQLPKLFGRLPKQKMIILPVEKFREKDASGASYTPGTQDGSRPGIVRVNTGDATSRKLIDTESTAYHEGVPGHHMQIAIQKELPELPPFRQNGNYSVYAEGWALYSERLGKEIGFYEDPYNDFGRLDDEMLRAIRLVVDTGLHSKKWTREQVVKYFHDHSSNDEPSVQSETNRYIVWPGQALGYKIGQMTILRLREQAKTELGDAFDIRAFHDEILGAGALPLDVLEARMNVWIARVKAQ